MINPNSHIFLYAKGHYKTTNTIKDLKKIFAHRNGVNPNQIRKRDILHMLANIVFPYLQDKHKFSLFILEIFKNNPEISLDFYTENTNIEFVINKFLSILMLVPVETNHKRLLFLDCPDFNILKSA